MAGLGLLSFASAEFSDRVVVVVNRRLRAVKLLKESAVSSECVYRLAIKCERKRGNYLHVLGFTSVALGIAKPFDISVDFLG